MCALVWVLLRSKCQDRLIAGDLLGERGGKWRRQEEPSDHNESLTVMKEDQVGRVSDYIQ